MKTVAARAWMQAAAACCIAVSAHADVSLVSRGPGRAPGVAVRMTAQGPWSPLGPVNDLTLNPAGDRMGDRTPSHAALAESVLAAWTRAADGSLQLAIGTRPTGWLRLDGIAGANADGIPRVISTNSGWRVLWQVSGAVPTVVTAGVAASAQTAPEIIDEGFLIDALGFPGSTVVVIATIPHLPEPIINRTLSVVTVVYAASTIPSIPEPIINRTKLVLADNVGVSPLRAPAQADTASIDGIAQVEQVEGRGHSSHSLLTWWTGPMELQFVELTSSGALLPVETVRASGGAAYSPSLANEARRIVSRR